MIFSKRRAFFCMPAVRRDVVMLADAVNQIAIIQEEVLISDYRTADIQRRLRHERERVAEIIDRYDP